MAKAKANPKDFAYQKLVRIGRIPVAKKGLTKGYHYANIAADIRMWSFYGAGPNAKLPRLTHNGLIRTAPVEKGPMSSIVNTSKGGGYAPMLVVDDTGHPNAISVQDLTTKLTPAESVCDLPSFVGAQIVQISQIVGELRDYLKSGSVEVIDAYFLCTSLKKQCREVLSFLHPSNMEAVNEMIESLERLLRKTSVRSFFARRTKLRVQATTSLEKLENSLSLEFFDRLDEMRTINALDSNVHRLTNEDRLHDRAILSELKILCQGVRLWPAEQARLFAALGTMAEMPFPAKKLSAQACQTLLFKLETFCLLANEHLAARKNGRAFAELFNKSEKPRDLRFDILFSETTGATVNDGKCLIASEEEVRTNRLITETGIVAEELRHARADWLATLAEKPEDLEAARWAHFIKHPAVAEYQKMLDNPGPSSAQSILTMLEILPYAKYNLIQYARHQGISPRELFGSKLVDRRIALLTPEQRAADGLSVASFAGECFAHKRSAHGLFSDSSIYLWTALELSPFIQGYTVGHELVHFHQIRAMMERETEALKGSPLEFARFLNFYGNFLGLASGTVEAVSADAALDRKPLYGFADLMNHGKRGSSWVSDMRQALKEGASAWNDRIGTYGSTLGYSTDISVQVKVKAIREVIPALENAKNITFAKELGLKLQLDAAHSALPSANTAQRARYKKMIEKQVHSPKLDWETLRVIASHQYPGVRFSRQTIAADNLSLEAPLVAIALGGSYNQTQQ